MALDILNPNVSADVAGQPAASEVVASQPGLTADATGAYMQLNPKNKILDPKQTSELLANMEKMIARKTGGWHDFMGGIQDALAYATPIQGGQQALALQYRNQQKAQEMQDVFNMRQQMAAMKSQAEMAQAQNAAADALLGGGDVVGGPGAGGPGAGGAGGIAIPPEVRAMIAANPAMKSQILNDYLKTASTKRLDAQGNIQGSYKIPGVEDLVNMTPNEYLTFQATGKLPAGIGGGAPGLQAAAAKAPQLPSDFAKLVERVEGSPEGSVSPKGATTTMQVMPGTARDPGFGVRPAADNSPEEVKRVGVDYANAMLNKYKGDQEAALIAYNAGPVVADKFLAAGRDAAVLPKETVGYLARAAKLQSEKPTQLAAATAPTAGIAPTSKENLEAIRKLKVAGGESQIAVTEAQQKEVAKQEGEKRAEYIKSLSTADNTFNDLNKLLDASKGQKQVFNLSGKGAAGPLAGSALQKFGFGDKTDENKNDTIARNLLPEDKQTAYNQIKTGAAVAQANFGKNLVEGAGGKLTNADLTLGKIAKGMGTEQTYDSHMYNLAKSMEAARTVYYRAQAFEKWQENHPNEPISKFETSKEYKTDAKIQAAIDVAKKVADVPELAGKFVHRDANGKAYVTVGNKSYYIGEGNQ